MRVMINKDLLINWLKLCNVKGLGSKRVLKLLQIFESIEDIVNADNKQLLASQVFNESMIKSWIQLKSASNENFEKVIRECEQYNIEILPLFSEKFPKQLKILFDTPLNLFLQGDMSLLCSKKVAIVGSRKSDENSKEWAYEWTQKISEAGFTIVSGGAEGIDYQAHRACLDAGGKTISVVGTGLLNMYPEKHLDLFREIKERGLLITENLPTFKGGRIALLRRNRITSGISDAIVSVTSSSNGGSMTQLNAAIKQNIPIFCPPISLNFSPSEGILKAKKTARITELTDLNLLLTETGMKRK